MTSELDLDEIRSSAEAGFCFTPEPVLAILFRLEQAEQDRVKLRNRLDAMRRQRDGYQNQIRRAEQQIARVRAFLEYRKAELLANSKPNQNLELIEQVQEAIDQPL